MPPTILVSIDGFSQDYLTRFDLPHLSTFAEQGVVAEALIPIFPSKTFPNHLSIVTGVYPVSHGIIGNSFYRADIHKVYRLNDGRYDSTWLTAKPIWTLAEERGLRSAVYFWPESETTVAGSLPSYFYKYEHERPNNERVEQVKTWLKMPLQKRPNFIALYFSMVDSAGHDYGRHSEELKSAVLEADRLVGELLDFIGHELHGMANIVVVSDHGMTKIDKSQLIYWKDHITPSAKTIVIEQQTQLYVYSDEIEEIQKFEKTFSTPQFTGRVYTKGSYPKSWHWQDDPAGRLPDLVVDLPPPIIFSSISKKNRQSGSEGIKAYSEAHGYDPRLYPEMNGIFMASGPSLKNGYSLKKFENIHIFSLLERLLALPPSQNVDASVEVVAEAFK
jgi:predicted AlkP superfamily pyrophosphatase or phosphodiesterase